MINFLGLDPSDHSILLPHTSYGSKLDNNLYTSLS